MFTFTKTIPQNGIHSVEMISGAENKIDEFDINIPNSRVGRFDHETHNYILENCDENSDGLVLIDFHKKRNDGQNMKCTNQVRWSRSNISATMERFEPTQRIHSMSPTPSLDYGFAATVVNSKPDTKNSLKTANFDDMPLEIIRGDEAGCSKSHIYSYAYYDPGDVNCHRNLPRNEKYTSNKTMAYKAIEISNNTQHNYVRTMLSKGHRPKPCMTINSSSSLRGEDRHTFTTRYGTTENLYEEVNEQKIRKVFSDNRIATSKNSVKEEIRRVQHNHFRVLDELNLSLEALIMPPSSQKTVQHSVNNMYDSSKSDVGSLATKNALASGVSDSIKIVSTKPQRYGLLGGDSSSLFPKGASNEFSATSLENLSNSIQSESLKDQLRNSNNNTDLDEGDLDSGFSGSGSSSGASYNESLRYFKPIIGNQVTLHTKYACCSPSSSVVFISKNSISCRENSETNITEDVANKYCGEVSLKSDDECTAYRSNHNPIDMQQVIVRSTPSETSTVSKSKRRFWTMKP